ncbi:hypothetical protein AAG570_013892 [Ranatra chinensis]|uniref:Uncharacterized protein n=1 Tax=Ranatra chinensis TaxID=642074 RepID=A0ABD0YDI9_9HEMI
MASKPRNMFQKNKTQETTENVHVVHQGCFPNGMRPPLEWTRARPLILRVCSDSPMKEPTECSNVKRRPWNGHGRADTLLIGTLGVLMGNVWVVGIFSRGSRAMSYDPTSTAEDGYYQNQVPINKLRAKGGDRSK